MDGTKASTTKAKPTPNTASAASCSSHAMDRGQSGFVGSKGVGPMRRKARMVRASPVRVHWEGGREGSNPRGRGGVSGGSGGGGGKWECC